MSNSKPATIRIVAIRQPFALFESRPWRPPLNIYETDQGIKLVAELAGISINDPLVVYLVYPYFSSCMNDLICAK